MVRPWIRRFALWVGPTLLLVLVWQIWDRREEARLAQQTQPLVDGTGGAAPTVGAGAGRYYLAAHVLVDFRGSGQQVLASAREALRRGEAPPQTVRDDLARLAVEFEPAADLVARAASLPLGSIDDLGSGVSDVRRSETDNAYAVVMLNRLVQGRIDVAVPDVISRLRYLRVFDGPLNWSTFDTKVMTATWVVNDLGLVLGRVDMTADRMATLDTALASIFQSDELERVLRNHASWLNTSLATVWSNPSQITPLGWPLRPLLRGQATVLMRTFGDCVAVARQPWPGRVTGMRRLTPASIVGPQVLWTPASFLDECRSEADLYALGEAKVRAARLALRLERYRQEHGDWPATLDSLADAADPALLDPFTGTPLKYRRQPTGFVVYGVGRDLHDDGGTVARIPVPGGSEAAPDVGLDVSLRATLRPK